RDVHCRAGEGVGEHCVTRAGAEAEHEDVHQAKGDEQTAECLLAVKGEPSFVHHRDGRHDPHPWASSWPPSPAPRRRRWNISLTRGGAATKSTIRAWMTLTMSTGIWGWASIWLPPAG